MRKAASWSSAALPASISDWVSSNCASAPLAGDSASAQQRALQSQNPNILPRLLADKPVLQMPGARSTACLELTVAQHECGLGWIHPICTLCTQQGCSAVPCHVAITNLPPCGCAEICLSEQTRYAYTKTTHLARGSGRARAAHARAWAHAWPAGMRARTPAEGCAQPQSSGPLAAARAAGAGSHGSAPVASVLRSANCGKVST